MGNIFTRNIPGKILLEQKPQTENPKHVSGKIRTITWAFMSEFLGTYSDSVSKFPNDISHFYGVDLKMAHFRHEEVVLAKNCIK